MHRAVWKIFSSQQGSCISPFAVKTAPTTCAAPWCSGAAPLGVKVAPTTHPNRKTRGSGLDRENHAPRYLSGGYLRGRDRSHNMRSAVVLRCSATRGQDHSWNAPDIRKTLGSGLDHENHTPRFLSDGYLRGRDRSHNMRSAVVLRCSATRGQDHSWNAPDIRKTRGSGWGRLVLTANGFAKLCRRLEQPHGLHFVTTIELLLEQLFLLASLGDGALLHRAVATDQFR